MNADATLMDLITRRRSVRGYADRTVGPEKLDKIIEAARLAPSACNVQGWRFIVVDQPDKLQAICSKGLGGVVANEWAKTAPVIIVGCFCKDLLTHRLGAAVKDLEYYLLDMGIAGEHMALMATALGLGTCWIGWFNKREIRKILRIPRTVRIAFLLTLGYPDQELQPVQDRLAKDEITFYNSWSA